MHVRTTLAHVSTSDNDHTPADISRVDDEPLPHFHRFEAEANTRGTALTA